MACRYDAAIAPVIAHVSQVLPAAELRSCMKDPNGQLCLDPQDLDMLPHPSLDRVNAWLEGKVHSLYAASRHQVSSTPVAAA